LKKQVYLENSEEVGVVKKIQEVEGREAEDVEEEIMTTEEMTLVITVKNRDISQEIVENKLVIVLEQMEGVLSVMKEVTRK
jgi:hypothetical protein